MSNSELETHKHVQIIVEFDGVLVWKNWYQDDGQCGGLGVTNTATLNHIENALKYALVQVQGFKHE